MAKVKTQFLCSECGYVSPKFLGRCPNCGRWNTLVEERISEPKNERKSRVSFEGKSSKPQLISEVKMHEEPRVKTGMEELNRVLGGV